MGKTARGARPRTKKTNTGTLNSQGQPTDLGFSNLKSGGQKYNGPKPLNNFTKGKGKGKTTQEGTGLGKSSRMNVGSVLSAFNKDTKKKKK